MRLSFACFVYFSEIIVESAQLSMNYEL